jgi:circadian clock protein KaiC
MAPHPPHRAEWRAKPGFECVEGSRTRDSNQVRELLITSDGVRLADVYLGPGGVLTGSAKRLQCEREKMEALQREQAVERQKAALEQRRKALEAHIAAMQAELEAEESRLAAEIVGDRKIQEGVVSGREKLARMLMMDGEEKV